MKGAVGWPVCLALAGLACAAPARAAAAVLDLACVGAHGRAVPGAEIKAIRADFSGDVMSAPAQGGRCRIGLEPGVYWVKAESPGRRSVPRRIRWPSCAEGRELRLLPLLGRNAQRQQALETMVEADQALREELQAAEQAGDGTRAARLRQAMNTVDAVNEARLRRWLAAAGFPRAADVGYEGVQAAWLLIQHSQQLLAAQLPALRIAAQAGELPRSSLALSEDRVRMQNGKPQRYGSQLQAGKDGKLVLYPLDRPEQVDARREAMDLEPLADGLKRLER